MERGFNYQACLPYETESRETALIQLDEILSELEKQYDQGLFQYYDYGTNYASDVWAQIRMSNAWIKCKNVIPLDRRVKLSKMFAQACFDAVEPVLVVRYGAACCSLWKGKRARKELLGLTNIIDWETLIQVVRNLVSLCPSTNGSDLNGSSYEHLTSLAFTEMVKQGSPTKVVLTMARLFRCTVVYRKELKEQMLDQILSYLGPRTHDPKDSSIMEAFCSLIPTKDLSYAAEFVPLLLELRHKVGGTLFYQCVVPVLAEFSELHHEKLISSSSEFLSNELLDSCFQAALYAFDIPLMSAQAMQSKKAMMRQTPPTVVMSGSGSRSSKSTVNKYNTSAHAVNSAAFAKLSINNSSLQDQRGLEKLDALINAVASFCHPSNSGSWSTLIIVTLSALTLEMSVRINTLNNIEQDSVDKFVLTLRPVVFMGVHNHVPFVVTSSSDIMRYSAIFSPDLICPMVSSEVYPTLQHGSHQAHRLVSSVAILSRLAVPLASNLKYKMHLTTLLELSLPNLDTNDSKRCLLTLDFFQALASVTAFEDCSDPSSIASATQVLPDCVRALEEKSEDSSLPLDDETLVAVVKGTSAAYPEILSFYMRRIFDLLESTSEQRSGSAAAASIVRVLLACSPQIFNKSLDIASGESSNPQQQNHDSFAQVCGSFVRANCAVAFPKMWKSLSANIREEIDENQAGSGRVALSKDSNFLRNLSVSNMCLSACNANVIIELESELRNLLSLVRAKTGQSVVYTAANTIHHAIVALTAHSVMLPSPEAFENGSKDKATGSIQLSCKTSDYLNSKWNIPSDASRKLAISIFTEHVDLSEQIISDNLDSASKNIQSEDAITTSLIFIRTAVGAIATSTRDDTVKAYRTKILGIISKVNETLDKDNVACLKEVLFVAKIWACDVGYERTSKLDQHLATLYNYEKRPFIVKGTQKRFLPPAILARRAQLYHHQRMSIATQHRQPDPETIGSINNLLIHSCFSAYPAVRRNASSASYSPSKIFNDLALYTQVYDTALHKMSDSLASKEFEKVEGGLALLRYRSFGVQTAGRNPAFICRFFDVCSEAASADYRHIGTSATLLYFTLLSEICRLGMNFDRERAEKCSIKFYMDEFVKHLSSDSLNKIHWRRALFKGSTLSAICQNPQWPIDENVLRLFIDGSLIDHPDVRNVCTLGVITSLQSTFRRTILPIEGSSKCRSDAPSATPGGFSHSPNDLENDWSSFYIQTIFESLKGSKNQLLQTCFTAPIGSQGWAIKPIEGFTKPPSEPLQLSNVFKDERLAQTFGNTKVIHLLENLMKIRKVEPRVEQDAFSHIFTSYFRDLIVLGDAYDSLPSILESSKSSRTSVDLNDKNWHRVSAELFCALSLSLPVLSETKQDILISSASELLLLASSNWSPENLRYWSSAMSCATMQVDHRRLRPIIENARSSATPTGVQDGGGIKLSMKMAFYSEILVVLQWHYPVLLEVCKQWPDFNHSSQVTRESAGDELSIAAYGVVRPSESSTLVVGRKEEEILTFSDNELSALQQVFDSQHPLDPTSKQNLSLLHLLLRLLQLLGGDTCLELLLSHGFPLLLLCSSVRDEPEMVTLVTNVLMELGAYHFAPKSALRLSDFLAERMTTTPGNQWHLRIRLLLFSQSFYFNHLSLLPPNKKHDLTLIVVESLNDPQVEVRDLAADTSSGIIRCSPPADQKAYVTMLKQRFNGNLTAETELVQRHAAVLGLGSLITAFPYTSPPPFWVPEILATSAVKAAGDSGVVGKSTKKILSDFKKTRQDTWHIDQTAFTQDQLDDLDGVLWRNYFA